MDPIDLARKLYDEYNERVGGVAYNGDVLPTWGDFRADPNKQKQSDAWVCVAIRAIHEVENLRQPQKPREG